ncbi:MAG: hypothetical protein HYU66_02175 [Armatimonadetes bacterium]|nr:hypothetical protein [Armatimonadota bacterium]
MGRFALVAAAVLSFTLALALLAADEPAGKPLFAEPFDDTDLLARGWYDGAKFTLGANGPAAGKGCIEFHWNEGGTKPAWSEGAPRATRCRPPRWSTSASTSGSRPAGAGPGATTTPT